MQGRLGQFEILRECVRVPVSPILTPWKGGPSLEGILGNGFPADFIDKILT